MQKRTAAKFLDVRLIQAQMGRSAKCLKIHKIIVEKLCFKKTLNYGAYFSLLLDLFFSFFSLQDCRQPFHHGSFFDHEGLPYCETHYHAKRGSLCAGCSKPITGRCITAMFKKFHPEHFVCAFCLKQLVKGTFKEQNDKPYCHVCFDKLFGWSVSSWILISFTYSLSVLPVSVPLISPWWAGMGLLHFN